MDTELLHADSPEALRRALTVLGAGGLVAFPTDTVYGLGALAFDAKAVESIYAAKNRPEEKAIPILLGSTDDLFKVISELPPMAVKLVSRFWPGPLTLILPKKPTLPESVSATPTVAVRVPNHSVARALLRAAGPMAVSSANLSGKAGCSTAQEVLTQLGGKVALILDGGNTPGGVPSTLVDCTGAEPVLLRDGPISLENILSALT